MRRKIVWQAWENPLLGQGEVGEVDDEDGPDIQPVAVTPLGLIALNAFEDPFDHLNLWLMHTTFTIDEAALHAVKRVPGVESVDVLGEYRMRVGFGLAFNDTVVKVAVQEALDCQPPRKGTTLSAEARSEVESLKRDLGREHPFWSIYVAPNGSCHADGAPDTALYERLKDLHEDARDRAGGVVFSSHD